MYIISCSYSFIRINLNITFWRNQYVDEKKINIYMNLRFAVVIIHIKLNNTFNVNINII